MEKSRLFIDLHTNSTFPIFFFNVIVQDVN